MEVSDVVRRVRESAGDMAVLQFTNATLVDWINDGVRECVIENSLLQAKANASTVASQADYTLPVDIFKIHSVKVDNFKLTMLTLEQWEEKYSGDFDGGDLTGTPTSCYIYAGVLTLYPVPDAVLPIVINYTKLPTSIDYSVGPPESFTPDTLSIPEAFHNRVVTYCLAQVAFQDDDYAKYQALMAEFSTGVRDLKHVKDQEDDLYPFISVSSRDTDDYDWFC